MQVKRLGYTEISHRDKALSFTDVPARRKPIRDYAGLARVRVGHGIQSGGVDGYDLSNSEYFLAGGRG